MSKEDNAAGLVAYQAETECMYPQEYTVRWEYNGEVRLAKVTTRNVGLQLIRALLKEGCKAELWQALEKIYD